MTPEPLHDEGGEGAPILLLHGLMGSARTWRRQIPWLQKFGRVYTFDAAGHGRPPPPTLTTGALTTEAFTADLVEHVRSIGEPVIVIGHSMGALHGWVLAAQYPELVRAIVVEDISPDFRGRGADDWAALIAAWPQPFPTPEAVVDFFGEVAGQYFLDSFDERADGFHLHGEVSTFVAISEEWGTRDFWAEWDASNIPALLIEGEFTITPEGQMREMHRRRAASEYLLVPGAGHLVHDEQPERYRAAVETFLSRLLLPE